SVVVTPESAIVNACIRWLWAHGIKARRQNTGAHKHEYTRKDGSKGESWVRYGKKGAGDIVACVKPHGRYLEVECKTERGVQDSDQIAHQKEIEADGGLYILARSVECLEARREEILGRGS